MISYIGGKLVYYLGYQHIQRGNSICIYQRLTQTHWSGKMKKTKMDAEESQNTRIESEWGGGGSQLEWKNPHKEGDWNLILCKFMDFAEIYTRESKCWTLKIQDVTTFTAENEAAVNEGDRNRSRTARDRRIWGVETLMSEKIFVLLNRQQRKSLWSSYSPFRSMGFCKTKCNPPLEPTVWIKNTWRAEISFYPKKTASEGSERKWLTYLYMMNLF